MDRGLPSLRLAQLRLARRLSPATFDYPYHLLTLLEDRACIPGANAVSRGTQANSNSDQNHSKIRQSTSLPCPLDSEISQYEFYIHT